MKGKLLVSVTTLIIGTMFGLLAASCSDSSPDPTPVPTPTPDPRDAAREWLADSTDAVSESALRLVLDALGEEGLVGTAIAELGGEWLEDRINEKVTWTLSEPVSNGNSHVLVARGAAQIEVDRGLIKGSLEITVPIELTVQGDRVIKDRVIVDEVSVSISN